MNIIIYLSVAYILNIFLIGFLNFVNIKMEEDSLNEMDIIIAWGLSFLSMPIFVLISLCVIVVYTSNKFKDFLEKKITL